MSQHRHGWPWRRKFSRRSCSGSSQRPFDHESGTVTTELSPLPVCKTSPDPIGFWLTVSGFGQTDPVRKANRCARISRPASGQRFRADPDRMRIRSGMFTGDANNNCTKDNNNRKAKVLGNRCAPFAKLSNCTITLLTDKNRSFANISKTPGNDYLQKGI